MRVSKAPVGRQAGEPWNRHWNAYGELQPLRCQAAKGRSPRTGTAIDAGLETDTRSQLRLFTLRLMCPGCREAQEFNVGEAAAAIATQRTPGSASSSQRGALSRARLSLTIEQAT